MKRSTIIWIVDRQQWPRAYLRALLIDRGFDTIGFIELGQAIAALRDPHYARPQLIVLELHDLSPTEDELEVLAHTSIPMMGLAGAMEMNEGWIKRMKWAAISERPVTIGKIADVIEGLLGN